MIKYRPEKSWVKLCKETNKGGKFTNMLVLGFRIVIVTLLTISPDHLCNVELMGETETTMVLNLFKRVNFFELLSRFF